MSGWQQRSVSIPVNHTLHDPWVPATGPGDCVYFHRSAYCIGHSNKHTSMTHVPFFAGVGSRETPPEILSLMYHVGFFMGHLGWGLSSGGAAGADDAFQRGMTDCPACQPVRQLRIYLINRHWELYRPDPSRGLYNSLEFTDTWDQAIEIATAARGSFERLGPAGRDLHTRNVFQVLHHTLKRPVQQLICWAKPVGRHGRVNGGTNTAVTIALQHDIPVMNLYLDEHRQRAEEFVTRMRDRFHDRLWIG